MSAASKRYMGKIAALSCLVCHKDSEVHHIRTGQGLSEKASDFLTIPLCPDHHRGAFSIHADRRQFQNIVGNELELLALTIELLNK